MRTKTETGYWSALGRVLALTAAVLLAVVLVPDVARADLAFYIERSWDGSKVSAVAKATNDATYLQNNSSGEDITWGSASGAWYAVDDGNEVTISGHIRVSGTANLILHDDARLIASTGFTVQDGSTLNVYGMKENTGMLVASNVPGCASIGGSGGTVNIHGGTVLAMVGDSGTKKGAGIGGGFGGSGGDVTVYGGTVTAEGGGSCAAGIGSGWTIHDRDLNGGNVTVYGGTVKATGAYAAAGIGGGVSGKGANVTICGGTVTAQGGIAGAGIGGGAYADGGNITITGATVYATAGGGVAGIGGGFGGNGGKVFINYGSTVKATGGAETREPRYGNKLGEGVGIGGGGSGHEPGHSEYDKPNGKNGYLEIGYPLYVYGSSTDDIEADTIDTMHVYFWQGGECPIRRFCMVINGNRPILPVVGSGTVADGTAADGTAATVQMWRLYNPNSGEHFYTASAGERDLLMAAGWTNEGEAWKAPSTSSAPVWRLYNANGGDHHYTASAGERDLLVAAGWVSEGIGWYSDAQERVPVYRAYNPNAATGAHHFTTSAGERDLLVVAGWADEGIGWYGVSYRTAAIRTANSPPLLGGPIHDLRRT